MCARVDGALQKGRGEENRRLDVSLRAMSSSRKRPSGPATPADSPTTKRRTSAADAPTNSHHQPAPTYVDVPPPESGQWCDSLRVAREDGKFLDITLLAGGWRIRANKTVLVSL